MWSTNVRSSKPHSCSYLFHCAGNDSSDETVRIYHACEGRIEKSVPRIAVWHHEACRVMTNGDPDGRIFLSHSHMNNGFFFLLTTVFFKFQTKLPDTPEYAKMQFHMMTSLQHNNEVT